MDAFSRLGDVQVAFEIPFHVSPKGLFICFVQCPSIDHSAPVHLFRHEIHVRYWESHGPSFWTTHMPF
jgi:hypothetical protein